MFEIDEQLRTDLAGKEGQFNCSVRCEFKFEGKRNEQSQQFRIMYQIQTMLEELQFWLCVCDISIRVVDGQYISSGRVQPGDIGTRHRAHRNRDAIGTLANRIAGQYPESSFSLGYRQLLS